MKLTLDINYDSDCECPCDDGDGRWQVYSFNTRHVRFKHPDEFTNDPEIERKLKVGLAFLLSYHEHGLCQWALKGEAHPCPWDTVGIAGIAVWEEEEDALGPKTYQERQQDARNFMEEYTAWSNGQCFRFTLTSDESEEDEPSIGCLYGSDILYQVIREEMTCYPEDVEVELTGDYAIHVQDHDIRPKKVKV